MGDPALPGAAVATDTDYGLEAMDTAFIGRSIAMADRHAQTQSDSQASVSLSYARHQALAEQWLGEFESSMAGIKAAAFNGISASTSDSIVNYLLIGARLSNSPNPSLPSSAPYFPYGPVSAQMAAMGMGMPPPAVDLSGVLAALQAIAVKLTAIAAKVGA